MTKILINGSLTASAEARVSVDERGFRFADGVFETIPVYLGLPYLWDYHIERLAAGLAALRMPHAPNLLPQVMELLRENNVRQGMVRIYVSRGVGSQGYLPAPGMVNTTVIQTLDMPTPPKEPVTLWLSTREKISNRALPAECKLAQGVNATLTRMEAADNHCHDALQLDAGGYISEASSANIFWLAKGTLYTPSLACSALAGVTRRRLMELSAYPVQEGEYRPDALGKAEAVVVTNASLGVLAVKSLNPGGMTWQSSALAQELTELRTRDIAKR